MNVPDHLVTPIGTADKCRAVRLTPAGRGAIATIRIEGASARELVQQHLCLFSGRPIRQWPTHRSTLAKWQHSASAEEPFAEEVIVYSPDVFTVEVHCHGGSASMQGILRQLATSGCQVETWSDFVSRAPGGSTRAEALLQLPYAITQSTSLRLLDQAQGALHQALDTSLREIERGDVAAAQRRLRQLLPTYELGSHLIAPWQIVLGGPANVGKSSLVNRLLGYERSLVFDQPGTTRDALRGISAIAGWPVEFVDTAGWRETHDSLESAGMQLGQAAWNAADVRLLVLDATAPAGWFRVPETMLNGGPPEVRRLLVWNKIDLLDRSQVERLPTSSIGHCAVSALTGSGCRELLEAIARLLVSDSPRRGSALVITARQYELLSAAADQIAAGNSSGACELIGKVMWGKLAGSA